MKSYGHIVIISNSYAVVLVVDGVPVLSQCGLSYLGAVSLKNQWGLK